jgi:hypothetical protein
MPKMTERVYTFDQMATMLSARGGDFGDKLMAIIASQQMTAADALSFVAPVAGYLLAQCGEGARERFIADLDERMAEFKEMRDAETDAGGQEDGGG